MTISNIESDLASDDEILRLFLTGRGHAAFRMLVRDVSEAGWPAPEVRFLVEALYSRLGLIIRAGPDVDDLLRYRRALQEILTECGSAPGDFRTRVNALSELVTDLINQEGGPHSALLFADPTVLELARHLAYVSCADEQSLQALIGNAARFNQAICSLLVAELVEWDEDSERSVYRITRKGKRRLFYHPEEEPFSKLRPPEDFRIYTVIQPIFDLLVLPFAKWLIETEGASPEGLDLSRFGIEIEAKEMERPLDLWHNFDEILLTWRLRQGDIGAMTLPRVRLSEMAAAESVDVAVGDTFFGFHLLIANDEARRLGLSKAGGVLPNFPVAAEEIKPLVKWSELPEWLERETVSIDILGDRATRQFMELMLTTLPDEAASRIDLVDVESNSGRLKRLASPFGGRVQVATATGPLLAIAKQAGLSILTTSWDMLLSAKRAGIPMETAGQALFKQYVLAGISNDEFLQDKDDSQDRIFRIMSFVREIYKVIVGNGGLFATYCKSQWSKLGDKFPNRDEFKFELSLQDLSFAIEASYCWLGHNLRELKPHSSWPNGVEELRRNGFWTEAEATRACWPTFLAEYERAEARIATLREQALALAAEHRPEAMTLIKERVAELRHIGALHHAEKGLQHAIALLSRQGLGRDEA